MAEEFSAEIRELIDSLAKTSRQLLDQLRAGSYVGFICDDHFMEALKKVADTTEDFEESGGR